MSIEMKKTELNFSHAREIEKIRGQLLRRGLFALTLLGIPAISASLIHVFGHDWQPIHRLHVCLGIMVVAAAILEPVLPLRWRAVLFLGAFLIFGFTSLYSLGAAGPGLLILAAFTLAVAIIFGVWAGLAAMLACLGIIFFVGWAAYLGQIHFTETDKYLRGFGTWLMAFTAFAFFISLVMAGYGNIHACLRTALRRLDQRSRDLAAANRALELEIIERQQAEEDKRKLEAQVLHAQKLESLGVLAGGIAHDFNNLLVTVMCNADLARLDIPADSPARESLQEIEKAAQRAAELCRQMLAYSGRGQFVIDVINLAELVQEMSDIMRISISKKAEIKYDFMDIEPLIAADSTQIRQVVMNLITNASEALADNPGRIVIRTGIQDCDPEYLQESVLDDCLEPGRYAFVEVEDSGCGMDEETKQRLFEPFFSTKFTGRGLGMAAALGIIRGHKGAVRVQTQPGQGSVIRILFPALPDALLEQFQAHTKPAEKPFAWQGRGTVLVVDDEPTVLETAEKVLPRAGFKVVTATDGVECLELMRQPPADLVCIILDLTMPRLDGRETLEALRGQGLKLPILLSSGFDEAEVSRKFTDAGMTAFVQKPYQSETLLGVLRGVLEPESGPSAG